MFVAFLVDILESIGFDGVELTLSSCFAHVASFCSLNFSPSIFWSVLISCQIKILCELERMWREIVHSTQGKVEEGSTQTIQAHKQICDPDIYSAVSITIELYAVRKFQSERFGKGCFKILQ